MKGLFSGNGLFGAPNTADSAGSITVANDTTTNATVYPLWAAGTSGNQDVFVSSTKLSFNPNSGLLTSTALSTGALTASGQPNFTGPTLIQKHVTGNTGAAYSMDATNGAFFDLTLDQNTTITFTESVIATQAQFFSLKLTQDGTGGRTVVFSGATWAAGVAPTMPSTANTGTLYASFIAVNGFIYGFAQLQPTDTLTLGSLLVNGATFSQVSVTPVTAGSGAPYVAIASQSRTVFTNEGTTVKAYVNLPTAAAGLDFTGIVQDADGLRLVAATGDTIRLAGTVSGSGGYIESTTLGSTIRIITINATEWLVESATGMWSVV